jgi:hypothetical protein
MACPAINGPLPIIIIKKNKFKKLLEFLKNSKKT